MPAPPRRRQPAPPPPRPQPPPTTLCRPDTDLPPSSVVTPVFILDAEVQAETIAACGNGTTEPVEAACLEPNAGAAPICAAMSNNTIYGGAYDMVSWQLTGIPGLAAGGGWPRWQRGGAGPRRRTRWCHRSTAASCPLAPSCLQVSAFQQTSLGAINTTCYPAQGWGLYANCMSAACIRGGPGGAATAWDGAPVTCFCLISNGTAGQYQVRKGAGAADGLLRGGGATAHPPCDVTRPPPNSAHCAGGRPLRHARGAAVRAAAGVHAVGQADDQLALSRQHSGS